MSFKCREIYSIKVCPSEARITQNNCQLSSVHVFRIRLASFGQLGLIRDAQIYSELQKGINDPNGLEKSLHYDESSVTFYGDHTVPITSLSKVQCVLLKGLYPLEARITPKN